MKSMKGSGNKRLLRQYWFFASIFLLTFPLNYTGKVLTTQKHAILPDLKLPNKSEQIHSRVDFDLPNSLIHGNVANHYAVTGILVGIFTIVQIVSAALLGLIFGYSNTVPLAKECLLSYIFQETTKSTFLVN